MDEGNVVAYMQKLSATLTQVVSRRKALALVAGSGPYMFALTTTVGGDLLHPREVLYVSDSGIPMLWNLYFEGGLKEVGLFLPGYLAQLDAIAHDVSPYQSQALHLGSQGHQLASLLCTQYRKMEDALNHAQVALRYGEKIGDHNLQAASQLRIALVYYYQKRPALRMATYERALLHWQHASPLIMARAHLGIAEVYSVYHDEFNARKHFEIAKRLYPALFMLDETFSYTHYNEWSFGVNEGRIYTNLPGMANAAIDALKRLEPDSPLPQVALGPQGQVYRAMNPELLEVHSSLCRATLVQGDLEMCASFVEETGSVARLQGNLLRLGEVLEVFEGRDGMLDRWASEPRVILLKRRVFPEQDETVKVARELVRTLR
jgi:tetratricopeptide (TPR) repeat protein